MHPRLGWFLSAGTRHVLQRIRLAGLAFALVLSRTEVGVVKSVEGAHSGSHFVQRCGSNGISAIVTTSKHLGS